MIQPTVYGQAIIITVYVPLLTFTRRRGQDVRADGADRDLRARRRLRPVAHVRAGDDRDRASPAECRKRERIRPGPETAVCAAAAPAHGIALSGDRWRGRAVRRGAYRSSTSLGQEFIPSLDEKNIAMHALRIPSTALTQSQAMQFAVEKTVSRFPQVAFVFSKTGTAEIASDPMPPSASDTFIILKPREAWPDPRLPKDDVGGGDRTRCEELPGNAYEFTQPIQMRFNELLAGVRGDIAVKVFGDEFDALLRAGDQIAGILRCVEGASDVRVEQVAGLPVLEITRTKRPSRAAV